MTPKFRFTIFNTLLYPTGIEVESPIGWDECLIGPERHTEFYSLVEKFDGSFIWFGKGREVILEIESSQGPDALASVTIDMSYGGPWELLTEQTLKISEHQDIGFHNKQYESDVPIEVNSFFAKFENRFKTSVDVRSVTDNDGNAIALRPILPLTLTSQKINQSRVAQNSNDPSVLFTGQYELGYLQYGGLDIFSNVITDEIDDWLTVPNTGVANLDDLLPQAKLKWDGHYTFNIELYLWGTNQYDHVDNNVNVFLKLGASAGIYNFTRTNFGASGVSGVTRFRLNISLDALAGDLLKIGTKNISGSIVSGITIPTSVFYIGTLNILGVTTFKNTVVDSMLVHDVLRSVTDRIVGINNSFYSDYFGSVALGYGTNGCGSANALMLGRHVRGATFIEKPFALSAEQGWNGANPVFNLGCGYDFVDGRKVIRWEPKEFFFNTVKSINISFVKNVKRRWDLEHLFKSFENGYKNSSIGSKGGLDDPQGIVRHHTRMKSVGLDFSALSEWFTGSLGIEWTRRQQLIDDTKDWQLDESTVLIALNKTTYASPELNENFDSVTNLLNPDARYNIRHSAKRLFKRWQNFYAGCLQVGARKDFYFDSGTGNNSMTSKLSVGDCEADGTVLSEKQNVVNNKPYLFTPGVYELDTPMLRSQYAAIMADRTKAIGISKTDAGHQTCFIISFRWQPTAGVVNGMLVWIK